MRRSPAPFHSRPIRCDLAKFTIIHADVRLDCEVATLPLGQPADHPRQNELRPAPIASAPINRTNTGHTPLPTHTSWPKDRLVLLAHLQSRTAPWPLPNCPSQSAPGQFQPHCGIPLSRSPANKLSR